MWLLCIWLGGWTATCVWTNIPLHCPGALDINFSGEVGYYPLIIGYWNFSPGKKFASLPPGHLVIIIGSHIEIEAIYENFRFMNKQSLRKT